MKPYSKKVGKMLILTICAITFAQSQVNSAHPASTQQLWTSFVPFQGNSIRAYLINNGLVFADSAVSSSKAGLYWPAETSNPVIYSSGLIVSALDEKRTLRTAPLFYRSPYMPGRILQPFADTNYSSAASYKDPSYGLLTVADTSTTADLRYQQWLSTASANGAPVKNGSPVRFGNLNAYWVMNDLDTSQWRKLVKHNPTPMGIEVRNYVFTLRDVEPFTNTIFIMMEIKNRSTHTYDSVYTGWFADFDLGMSVNNHVGCDTLLSLGYTYYGYPTDQYFGAKPPAAGFVVLESPTSNKGGKLMTSFMKDAGEYSVGYLQSGVANSDSGFMYYLRGKNSFGQPIRDLKDQSHILNYCVPGDPVTKTGWISSDDSPPFDMRQLQSSGPFSLKPDESVRFSLALLIAQDTGSISSVRKLKEQAVLVRNKWNSMSPKMGVQKSVIKVQDYALSNAYPNPFNPATTISYSLPRSGDVRLVVSDYLGREVAVLAEGYKAAGTYDVRFDASKLASGVYFYSIRSGNYTAVKRMMFLK